MPLTPEQKKAIEARLRPDQRVDFVENESFFFLYSSSAVDESQFPGFSFRSATLLGERLSNSNKELPAEMMILFRQVG